MSSNNGSGTTINTGGGGAAGGVAVGTSDTRAASEVVVDVVVIFVAIAVGVLAIVLVVYFMSVVFDKYCCCFPWFMTVGDHTQEFDHGPIARKAGLWGLRREERMAILEKLLPGKVSVCLLCFVCGFVCVCMAFAQHLSSSSSCVAVFQRHG